MMTKYAASAWSKTQTSKSIMFRDVVCGRDGEEPYRRPEENQNVLRSTETTTKHKTDVDDHEDSDNGQIRDVVDRFICERPDLDGVRPVDRVKLFSFQAEFDRALIKRRVGADRTVAAVILAALESTAGAIVPVSG